MDLSKIKSITIPEGKVKKITRKIDGTVLWKSGYKNWVKYSTEADGITIYNGGLGYKDRLRVRSGGQEAENNGSSCTGYILAKGGDTIRLSGYEVSTESVSNAINVFDKNFTVLGQIVSNNSTWGYGFFQGSTENSWNEYNWGNAKGVKEEKTGVWAWTVPPDTSIAFIRVTGDTGNDGSTMIVTVNEEIT